MIEYAINACKRDVVDLETWIPIAETYIQSETQSEIKVGKITLRTITEDKMKEWIKIADKMQKS